MGVRTGINLIRLFAVLGQPVVPTLSASLLACVSLPPEETAWPDAPAAELLVALKPGHPFQTGDVLIEKITDEQVAEWAAQFGGVETD